MRLLKSMSTMNPITMRMYTCVCNDVPDERSIHTIAIHTESQRIVITNSAHNPMFGIVHKTSAPAFGGVFRGPNPDSEMREPMDVGTPVLTQEDMKSWEEWRKLCSQPMSAFGPASSPVSGAMFGGAQPSQKTESDEFRRRLSSFTRIQLEYVLSELRLKTTTNMNMSDRIQHEANIEDVKARIDAMEPDNRVVEILRVLSNIKKVDMSVVKLNLAKASDQDIELLFHLLSSENGPGRVSDILGKDYAKHAMQYT